MAVLSVSEGAADTCLAGDDRAIAVARLAVDLDDLEMVPFSDPEAAYQPAVFMGQAALALEAVDLQMRAQLVEADVLCRRGQTAAGGRLIREVNRWAVQNAHGHLMARSNRLLALFFSYVGDIPRSLEHAIRALELLEDASSPRLRADHLLALATALAETGAMSNARSRLDAAGQIAEAVGDVRLRIAVLNTQAWVATDAGDLAMSLEIAEQMRALATANGVALDAPELESLARAQLDLGMYAEAEATLQPVFDDGVLSGEGNALAYCLVTLAKIQRRQGKLTAAGVTLKRCRQVCDERGLALIRVIAEQELAHVYAGEGRYQEAFEQHVRFHEADEALRSVERSARAEAVQAVFETDEARKDSQRFQDVALHDPLTGMYNRRFVEDELPAMLRQAAETATPLSVGLFDLDNFKQINDTFSHRMGDEVLRHAASILDTSISAPDFVARIGGEEFLVVLPGAGMAAASERFQTLVEAFRSGRWEGIVPLGPLTVSVGAATTTAGRSGQTDLLERADHNLYRAKRAGRDRVVDDRD